MAPPTITNTMPAAWPRASSPAYRQPRFLRGATSMQTLSQIFLVLQNSALIMVMHHSRAKPASGHRRYFISTAMMFVELTKLVLSLAMACRAQIKAQIADAAKAAANSDDSKERPSPSPQPDPYSLSNITSILYQALFASGSWMLILPAGLYALQTHLVYVAVSNMETVPFQVTYQLKILTTVLFSIVMLQRVITPRQWLALVLLTLGVAIVQVTETSGGGSGAGAKTAMSASASPSSFSLANLIGWFSGGGSSTNSTNSTQITTAAPKLAHHMNTSKGFIAAIAASLISGFTGVYFEKLIKESRISVSLWTRNAQLSFFSLFPILLLGVWCKDGAAIAEYGFFVGYGPTVWATIGLQALGGILVAICITYADNVAKNLAASFSIVVSYMANAALFGEPMTLQSTVGISTVLFALYLYQSRSSRSPPDSPLLPVDRDGLVDVRSKELHEK